MPILVRQYAIHAEKIRICVFVAFAGKVVLILVFGHDHDIGELHSVSRIAGIGVVFRIEPGLQPFAGEEGGPDLAAVDAADIGFLAGSGMENNHAAVVAEIDLGIGLGDEIGEEIVQIDIDGIRGVGPVPGHGPRKREYSRMQSVAQIVAVVGGVSEKIAQMQHPAVEEGGIVDEVVGIDGSGLKGLVTELNPEDQNVVGYRFGRVFPGG